jgi:hypothetical protein
MVGAHLSEENVAEHAANSLRLAVGARRARREGARGCAPSDSETAHSARAARRDYKGGSVLTVRTDG